MEGGPMYRLIALDVDGTILDDQHRLSDLTRDAIIQAQRHGARICLATGKLLDSVSFLIEALHLTGWQITCNGAALMDVESRVAIESWPLDAETFAAALAVVRAVAPDQAIAMYTSEAIYTDDTSGALDRVLAAYHEPALHHVVRLEDLDLPALKFLMQGDADRLAELYKRLSAALDGRATVFRTTADFVEIVAPGVSKGCALTTLAEARGVTRGEIVAIGDGENDLPLFEASGVRIAMANAMLALRDRADVITATANQSGVAHALAALGLATAGDPSLARWIRR
jgi:Cof subfamily protein (haloacid dehalogenase superfamily)